MLVVDDEQVIRDLTRLALEDAGFRTLDAEDGGQAIEVYRREGSGVDLVILDLTLPDMRGDDVLRELRELDADVRVVICSGHSEHEVRDMLGTDAIQGVLPKPFRPPDLIRAVDAALGG